MKMHTKYSEQLIRLETAGRQLRNDIGQWPPAIWAEYFRILHRHNAEVYRRRRNGIRSA